MQSINFRQDSNFPKNARQNNFSMWQRLETDELFIERFCLFILLERTSRRANRLGNKRLISFPASSWSVCSHAVSSLCCFTIPILVIKSELTITFKVDGI